MPSVTLNLTGGATDFDADRQLGQLSVFISCFGRELYRDADEERPRRALPGINTVDVIATQRHFLVIGTPLAGCRLTAADVNGDTNVNTVDVIAIQRFFLGLTTGIANVGKYQFTPASRTYPGCEQPDRPELRHADLRRRRCSFCRSSGWPVTRATA